MSHSVEYITLSPTKAASVAEDQTTRACLSLNKETLDLLEHIRKHSGLSRCDTARRVIDAFRTGEVSAEDLSKFLTEFWAKRHKKQKEASHMSRLDWSKDLDEFLIALTLKLTGSANRSEGFRILVICYAVKKGFAQIEWVKIPYFTATDPKPL